MKAEDLKTKTVDELAKTLLELRKKQFNLRFQKSQGQLEKTAQVRVLRRDIARVKTFMAQQEAGAVVKETKKATKPAAAKKPATKKPAAKKAAPKKAEKSDGKAA